jgi:hypothetical protein
LDASHDSPSDAPFHAPAASRAVPRLPCDTLLLEERVYDRPGKKPAAQFQPDPLKLEETCRQTEGSAFAVDWIISTFKYGVSTEALLRVLGRTEIDKMNFPGGFEPHQAYDGFISKVGKRYECGLCREGKRTQWKNKKDAPRHLRKFHFGLADVCEHWCVKRGRFPFMRVSNYISVCICSEKDVFSRAEMKTHRCVRRTKDGTQVESSEVR